MPDAPSSTMTDTASILIIDDEEIIREALEALLSAEGYRVRTAATATEGMEQVAAGPLDAVLLDLMLPDRNGLEVLEEIRRFDEDLPVEIGRASCRERVWSSVAAGQ